MHTHTHVYASIKCCFDMLMWKAIARNGKTKHEFSVKHQITWTPKWLNQFHLLNCLYLNLNVKIGEIIRKKWNYKTVTSRKNGKKSNYFNGGIALILGQSFNLESDLVQMNKKQTWLCSVTVISETRVSHCDVALTRYLQWSRPIFILFLWFNPRKQIIN